MTTAIAQATAAIPTKRGTWLTLWLRFRRKKAALVGLVLIVLQIAIAILAPVVAPYDPNTGDYPAAWQGPSAKHWLGADDLGRDVLSRLIFGARISIAVGILSQLSVVVIGLPIGAVAGLLGGWVDYAVMRVIEILAALPTILLYILLMVALGPGFLNIIIAMSLTGWLGIARLVRGQVLSLKQTDYVRAARAMGGDTRHIIATHIVRNTLSPVLVTITLGVPGAIFAEAGLSFLGLGIRPPDPSWGQMIGLYQQYIQSAWHLTVFPAIVLAITMLAWHLVGDGLREALDPTIRV